MTPLALSPGLAPAPGGHLQPALPHITWGMRLALSPAHPDRKTGDQRLRRRRKPNYPCCFLQPGPERSFSEGCACVSSSQRGSGDARGAKNSLTWAPGAGGEGRGWGMAWDAEAELATPCCPCEPGPVHLSPSQSIPVHPSSPQKSAGGFRQAAGAAGRGASALGGFCSSVPWKYGVHLWYRAAPRPAA